MYNFGLTVAYTVLLYWLDLIITWPSQQCDILCVKTKASLTNRCWFQNVYNDRLRRSMSSVANACSGHRVQHVIFCENLGLHMQIDHTFPFWLFHFQIDRKIYNHWFLRNNRCVGRWNSQRLQELCTRWAYQCFWRMHCNRQDTGLQVGGHCLFWGLPGSLSAWRLVWLVSESIE